MIGNDIVDLELALRESNWRRKGFLNKLFTTSEQQLIESSHDPDVLVWTLWSMKESAYKLIVRQTGQRFYAPQKLICHLNALHSGEIKGSVFYQKLYHTASIITTRYVASTAFLPTISSTFIHEFVTFDRMDYQHQHKSLQEKIKQHYATRFSIPERSIQIHKNDATVPTLIISDSSGKTISEKSISLSHHGHYGAFAIA